MTSAREADGVPQIRQTVTRSKLVGLMAVLVAGELLARMIWVGVATLYSQATTSVHISYWVLMRFFTSIAFDSVVPHWIVHSQNTKLTFVVGSYAVSFVSLGLVPAIVRRRRSR